MRLVLQAHLSLVVATWLTVGFPGIAHAQGPDDDGDGVPNSVDSCPLVANLSRLDSDLDGYGNACDADYNNDGIVGSVDFAKLSMAYGSVEGEASWKPYADCNGDDRIDDVDFFYMASVFGNPPGPSGLSCAGSGVCNLGCTGVEPPCDPRWPNLDCTYEPISFAPAYTGCAGVQPGPKILVDTTHSNNETTPDFEAGTIGKYWGFAKLLSADGYDVRDSGVPLTQLLLPNVTDADILVIAAAQPNSPLPGAPSPFTSAEVVAVRDWVASGGSLLLVVDHDPYNDISNLLSAFFTTVVLEGATTGSFFSPDDFVRGTVRLNVSPPIADGLTLGVNKVQTFSGVAFVLTDPVPPPPDLQPPPPPQIIVPLLTFSPPAFTDDPVDISGFLQGIAFTFGNGRVYLSGEAAMFTAQKDLIKFGMNATGFPPATELTNDNQRFLLNIVHWLSGL
ncbi:MAG TPA: thrombospondin type 3 repeat-containing protein [Gemmatimonadales bacterium]|nr:thrombospondin type 3 repeat-containing protein [Gemmatimonadales bacterium]